MTNNRAMQIIGEQRKKLEEEKGNIIRFVIGHKYGADRFICVSNYLWYAIPY
jgi:5'(3')-deoxyribonucleotidase